MRGWKKCFLTPPLVQLQNTGSLISLSLDHKIKSIYTGMTRSSKPSDKVDLSDREICLIKRS